MKKLFFLMFIFTGCAVAQYQDDAYPGIGSDSINASYINGTNPDACMKFKTTGANGFLFDNGVGTIAKIGAFTMDTVWLAGGSGVGYVTAGPSYDVPDGTVYIQKYVGMNDSGNISARDIVYPAITVGGNDASRTFTVDVSRLFGIVGNANRTRFLIHYWISTSSYGTPSDPLGVQSYSITTGTNFGTVSITNVNHAFTNSSGVLVLTGTTALDASPGTFYFHAEVQGILYVASGSLYTGTN